MSHILIPDKYSDLWVLFPQAQQAGCMMEFKGNYLKGKNDIKLLTCIYYLSEKNFSWSLVLIWREQSVT